jgi:trehalose 6-phosphate synthase
MSPAHLLVASNRGPVSFVEDDSGALTARRGGGGLVSGLSSLGRDGDALWVCAALSQADRAAVREAAGGRLDLAGYDTVAGPLRMLDIDPLTFSRAYNAIANSTLWFVHHLLYATALQPNFDASFRQQWASYEDYNRAFAEALAADAAPGARVVIQDYHLVLVPQMLRALRPDLRIGHFSHTPWAPVDYYRLLPVDVAAEVLRGVLGADHAGFLSPRWADAFLDCCDAVLGARVDREARTVEHDGRRTQVAVHALGVDGPDLRRRAGQPDVEARLATLLGQVGECQVIVRVDRTELSKNIVRGLHAYRELLRRRPEWHGRVVHIAGAYPSRHDLPEYREYTAVVQRVGNEINEEFGSASWQPLLLHVNDDYPRSLASMRIADVLLVNPVRDGMNLVAKEGPVLSERCGVLVLSTEAGAAVELGEHALLVNPYDVSATADALHRALSMTADERRTRADALAAACTALPPARWFADQLAALEP